MVKQTAENGKKSRVTKRPILCHRCLASSIWGYGMVMNLTGDDMFTMAGRLRSDSGWSWTFRIACVTLHDCEVAPLTSHMFARAIFFFATCLTAFPLEFRPQTFTIGFYKKKSIRSELMILECSFPLGEGVILSNMPSFHVWLHEIQIESLQNHFGSKNEIYSVRDGLPGEFLEGGRYFFNVCAGRGSSLQKCGSMVHCVSLAPGTIPWIQLENVEKIGLLEHEVSNSGFESSGYRCTVLRDV